MATGIIAVIGFFSAIILTIYLFFKTRHKERLDLIQSGNTADIFHPNFMNSRVQILKWGVIIFFVGLGVLLGGLLEKSQFVDEGFASFFAILTSGAIGMILFYFISANLEEQDD